MNSIARWLVVTFMMTICSLSSAGALNEAVKRHDVVARAIEGRANVENLQPRAHGKVGLVWANGVDDHLHQYVTSKTHYLYTWHPHCPSRAAELGLACGRMLWGPRELILFRELRTHPGTWILIGMNEVNEPSQSNISPEYGIKLWNEEIRPFGLKGYKLVSPSVTSGPSGKAWFKKFFAGCGNYDGQSHCGVHVLAIHIYVTGVSTFKSMATDFHNSFGLTMWISEFACQDFVGGPQASMSHIWEFMTQVTQWMNEQNWIEAYFAFGLLHDMWNVNYANQLMKSDGSPSSLGHYYINS
ncbi:glycoside hydrolase family 128 protein [Hydnum rufescens UP504]|uniref:Glycoside hydrolase family 128 protein n=1 Tax=Hydnum rufescens UP504 TaxID=1448309 RepID=A0A9P6DZZ7_9AGAM|nr:glycoside hydrolase family 128 protein [Hydnum rufescens UP504]